MTQQTNTRILALIAAFDSYAQHAWLARCYKKLTAAERAWVREFLAANGSKDRDALALQINRLFIDSASRPKHHAEMVELLICTNSKVD